jgi:hypothetical protein
MSPLRNLTGDSIDDLREERDRLIEENMRLKSGDYEEEEQVEKSSQNPNLVKYLRSKVSSKSSLFIFRSITSNEQLKNLKKSVQCYLSGLRWPKNN